MKFSFGLAALWSASLAAGSPLATRGNGNSFSWANTKYFLAFGDSYTYVQGTAGLQNYSFIGDAQNYSFTPSQLLGDSIVQNQIGTSAGGPNWVEYLTGCFSGLPSKCKTQLWDFAFAGSDVSTDFTPLHHNYTVPFVSQIQQWATYAYPVLKLKPEETLVAVWIGINDISDSAKYTYPRPAPSNATSFPQLYQQIVDEQFEALETVWDKGFRNYLVMGLPPLEKTPGNVVPGAVPSPNATQVALYNQILFDRANLFASEHNGASLSNSQTQVLTFNTHGFLNAIIENPTPYGIKNTTSYCKNYDAPDINTNPAKYDCLPIYEYFWYNTGHITYRVHQLLAEELVNFLSGS